MDETIFAQRGFDALGIAEKPKLHLMQHMAVRALRMGSPKLGGTWRDEGINRNLKDAAATAHRLVWDKRVLATFRSSVTDAKRSRR